jgi:hypothetical protein
MKILLALLFFLSTLILSGADKGKAYLFSYFKGNGEDGLHLAYSLDGYNFKVLNNDQSFLKPVVGVSKLMRDPCIIQTPDGTFHMVWTAGWTEHGIGYASSKDLINWSEQKYLIVMEKEPSARNTWAPEIIYDKKQKQFLIIWSTTIPGRFPEILDIITGYTILLQKTLIHFRKQSCSTMRDSMLLMQQSTKMEKSS